MLFGVDGQRNAPVGKNSGTHDTWGWMGPRAGLDGWRHLLPPTGVRTADRDWFC